MLRTIATHNRFFFSNAVPATMNSNADSKKTSLNDFMLANEVAVAGQVTDSQERISVPAPDWDIFYDALINPPEPNGKLKEAARRYRQRVGE